MIPEKEENGITLLVLENKKIRAEIAPGLGGKFTSIRNKELAKEFLWRNASLELEKLPAGADYDTNFQGGIDELIPNDIPEPIDGIDYPDHGELWTTALDYRTDGKQVFLSGILPLSGLLYQKTVSLHAGKPEIEIRYTIRNTTGRPRHFLWKLHAALQISAGDRLLTPASRGRIVYPGSSRFTDRGEFAWPEIDGTDASVVPPQTGTMDFFYLYGTTEGTMSMLSDGDTFRFSYRYDPAVFPYQWYFASYGQFRDHYTAILEPASAMPVSVNEAAALGQCTVLNPGQEINTTVTIYAGENLSPDPSRTAFAGEERSPDSF